MPTPTHISAGTPTPFTIVRNLVTFDADENEIRLPGVRITIEDADWSVDAVEEGGFTGDWCVHLLDDPAIVALALDEEALEAAEDCVCHLVEDLASRLSRGESVPVAGDDEQDWYPKASWNF